jgi:mono/diheme cytochrome c family protein
VQTVRGKAGAAAFDEQGIPLAAARRSQGISTPVFEAAVVLVALGLAGVAGVAGYVIGHAGTKATKTVTVSPATTTPAAGGGSATAGAKVFTSVGCGGCHTLAAAGTSGRVGPVLDGLPLTEALVVDRVTHGKGGMPSFATRLSAQRIADVAAYVVASAKR